MTDVDSGVMYADGLNGIGVPDLPSLPKDKGLVYLAGFVLRETPLSVFKGAALEQIKEKIENGTALLVEEGGEKYVQMPSFAYAATHYHDDIGNFKCLDLANSTNPRRQAICCKELGVPKFRIVTILVLYTNVDSKVGKMKGEPNINSWELRAFRMNENKYRDIQINAEDHPLVSTDYKFTCTNPGYNDYSINPGSGSAWQSDPDIKAAVMAEAEKHWLKVEAKHLGFKASAEKIREGLGLLSKEASSKEMSEEDVEKKVDSILG